MKGQLEFRHAPSCLPVCPSTQYTCALRLLTGRLFGGCCSRHEPWSAQANGSQAWHAVLCADYAAGMRAGEWCALCGLCTGAVTVG